MPQMAPLLWLPLFIFMLATIIWVKSNTFFIYVFKPASCPSSSAKPTPTIWQW